MTIEEELQQINHDIFEIREVYLDILEYRYSLLSDRGITDKAQDSVIRHHLITLYESITKLGIINQSIINNQKSLIMRLQISIEANKLQGAIVKNGWLCIPPQLVKHTDNAAYLNFTAYERKEVGKYGDTHFLKLSYPREVFENLTPEQKANIPICGNIKPLDTSNAQPTPAPTSWDNEQPDLPF